MGNTNDLANSIYDAFLGNLELIGDMEIEELEGLITEIDNTINRVARFDSNNQEIAATSSKIINDIANSLEKRNTIKLAFGFSDDTVGVSLLVALLIVLIILVSIYTVKLYR